jgi:hypothetical protein
MTRSIQRSKCRRAGCLLCCPWKATGERPVSKQRATQESVRTLVEDATDPSCSCEGCSNASECPGCGELWCECDAAE